MNYRVTIILLLGLGCLISSFQSIYTMEKECELTFKKEFFIEADTIFRILNEYFEVKEKEDQISIITKGDYATYYTEIRPLEYTCSPKNDSSFTNLLFNIYNYAYETGAVRVQSQQSKILNAQLNKIRAKKSKLKQKNIELEKINIALNRQLQQKYQYAETIEQPKLRENIINSRKTKSLFLNNIGFVFLGAGIASGIWAYLHFKK